MADQGRWFKLWCAAADDPDLDNLDIGDFGRYCKLGTFVKEHGTDGVVVIRPPARGLCAKLQVEDFAALECAIARLHNVELRRGNGAVSPETDLTVTYRNWLKYQGDYSTPRVRQFRAMERSKRRREEKRREERTTDPIGSVSGWHPTACRLLTFLNEKTGGHYRPVPANLNLIRARLRDGATEADIRGVIVHKLREWRGDAKMATYLRPKTLFNATNFAQYQGEIAKELPHGLP